MPAGTSYALGRFRGSGGDDFCGVVIGTDVVPLAALHPTAASIEDLLSAWPASEKLLGAAVDETKAGAGRRWPAPQTPSPRSRRTCPARSSRAARTTRPTSCS